MKFLGIKAKWSVTGSAITMLTWMVLFPYSSQALTTPEREGEATFKATCTACHGAFGSGSTVIGKKLNLRDLRSEEVQKLSDAQLHHRQRQKQNAGVCEEPWRGENQTTRSLYPRVGQEALSAHSLMIGYEYRLDGSGCSDGQENDSVLRSLKLVVPLIGCT